MYFLTEVTEEHVREAVRLVEASKVLTCLRCVFFVVGVVLSVLLLCVSRRLPS